MPGRYLGETACTYDAKCSNALYTVHNLSCTAKLFSYLQIWSLCCPGYFDRSLIHQNLCMHSGCYGIFPVDAFAIFCVLIPLAAGPNQEPVFSSIRIFYVVELILTSFTKSLNIAIQASTKG